MAGNARARRARGAALVTGLLGVVVGAASVVAACVPQPLLLMEPRSSAAPGKHLRVSGLQFNAGPAEVRWNAVDGPLLARAEGTDFSVDITVPKVADGFYTIVAVSRDAGGGVTGMARAPVQVFPGPARGGGSAAVEPAGTSAGDDNDGLVVAVLAAVAALVVGMLFGARGKAAGRRPATSA